jgi:uncharacterized protein YqeY
LVRITGEIGVKEKLQGDLKAAMKAGEKLRLMTVRGVLAEVTRLEKDVRRDANDDEIVQIIKRERARRDESLDFARRGKRFDLVTQYEAEAKILESYLPAGVGEEELNAAVAAQVAAGVNQIGPIMKALRDQFGARLDGKMASAAVKAAIAPK